MIQRLLNNNLADLAGTRIEGQIVLSDELMNEVIQMGLTQMTATPVVPINPPSGEKTPEVEINPRDLLTALNIEKLNYRTENGKTIIEVKAGV